MSIDSLRSDIASALRHQADIEAKVGSLRIEVGRLHEDVARAQRDAARATSVSSATSHLQKAARKLKEAGDKEKRISDLEKKASAEVTRRARAEKQLTSELARSHQRERDAQNRRHSEQLRNSRELTAEFEYQRSLQRSIAEQTGPTMPEKISVLFLAANPLDTQPLRLDAEVRSITEKLRMSEHRDAVELISRWAVRTTDVLQHLNEHRPEVIHFSGHGGSDGSLCFEGSDGQAKDVAVEAIAATLASAGDDVVVVLFNACFSAAQAQAAVRHIPVAIGMSDELDDEAASVFASHFYSAIGFGHSIKKAFEQAQAALRLDGQDDADIVCLFLRDGSDEERILVGRPCRAQPLGDP